MAGITLEQAEARLTEYLAAEAAVLSGQKYSIDGTELTRADLDAIQKGVDIWNTRAKSLSLDSGVSASVGLRVREVNL